MLLTDNLHLSRFDATRWVVNTSAGRNLLLNAPAARLFNLLCASDSMAQVQARYELEFGQLISIEQLTSLLQQQFGGYQILRDDQMPLRPLPANPLTLQVELIAPAVAGALARPLVMLYDPRVFWPALAITMVALACTLGLDSRPLPVLGQGSWLALALFYVSFLVHELGHIAACRRVGVSHGGIGFGFYLVVLPVLYADITNVWSATRQQRIIANLGGIFSQLLYCSALVLLYLATGHESLRLAAFSVGMMALWQLNPFVRHDGYWLLADLTNTPNLLLQALKHQKRCLSVAGLRLLCMSRGRVLLHKRLPLLLYALSNSLLIGVFIVSTWLHFQPQIVDFPSTITTWLSLVLQGRLQLLEVNESHLLILIFYVMLTRFFWFRLARWEASRAAV